MLKEAAFKRRSNSPQNHFFGIRSSNMPVAGFGLSYGSKNGFGGLNSLLQALYIC